MEWLSVCASQHQRVETGKDQLPLAAFNNDSPPFPSPPLPSLPLPSLPLPSPPLPSPPLPSPPLPSPPLPSLPLPSLPQTDSCESVQRSLVALVEAVELATMKVVDQRKSKTQNCSALLKVAMHWQGMKLASC